MQNHKHAKHKTIPTTEHRTDVYLMQEIGGWVNIKWFLFATL